MALTVKEAEAVTRLLGWMADIEASDRTDDQVREDAAFLAERAHKTMEVGPDVESIWPKVIEHRALARRALDGLTAAQDSDGAAQAVCRGIQQHLIHNGSIPWPSISRPYDEWRDLQS